MSPASQIANAAGPDAVLTMTLPPNFMNIAPPWPRARKLQNEPNSLRPRITFWKPTSTSQARTWKKAPWAASCIVTFQSKQHRQ